MPAIGLALKNFVGPAETPDIDALYTYAARAEALGFESLWAWDHVILGVEPSFPILDAVGTLTAIAARTSRIKLGTGVLVRSEEHTSELQSRLHLVCRLLLEKKKKTQRTRHVKRSSTITSQIRYPTCD